MPRTGTSPSLYPGGVCEPCGDRKHHRCLGWRGPGICGCTGGLCGIRLITGVMWDIDEPDNQQGEP